MGSGSKVHLNLLALGGVGPAALLDELLLDTHLQVGFRVWGELQCSGTFYAWRCTPGAESPLVGEVELVPPGW